MDSFETARNEAVRGQGLVTAPGQGLGQGLAPGPGPGPGQAALCIEYQGIEEYDPNRLHDTNDHHKPFILAWI